MSSSKRRVQADGAQNGEGIDSFIRGVSALAWQAYVAPDGTDEFVRNLADRYAYIRLEDVGSMPRFLRQMAGVPPVQLGTDGFRSSLVDDDNPARHYVALLFIGFYVPGFLATVFLLLWELAGFVRYRGQWSWPDIRSGNVGIRHGRLVRKYGPVVLPGLIAASLADR